MKGRNPVQALKKKENQLDKMDVEEQVASHGMLPSIMDSKLWRVKCIPGLEK